MKDIEKAKVQELVKLHQEVLEALQKSLEKAIRAGEILTEIKVSLNHGEWMPWLRDNIPFSGRTAREYMRLYRERDKIKMARVANLNEAYKLLAPPTKMKPVTREEFRAVIIDETSTTKERAEALNKLIDIFERINKEINDDSWAIDYVCNHICNGIGPCFMKDPLLVIILFGCFIGRLKEYANEYGIDSLPEGAQSFLRRMKDKGFSWCGSLGKYWPVQDD